MDTSATTLQLSGRQPAQADQYEFETRDGLLSNGEFRTAELALVETVEPRSDDDVLALDANYGVVGTVLASTAPDGETLMTESSARAADCCRTNAERNGVDNASVELTADVGAVREGFDVLVHAPKPYEPTDVVTEKLSKGLSRLTPGGVCYLAGAKTAGVTRYADALEEFAGDVEQVTVTDGCHVYRAERPAEFESTFEVEDQEFRASVGEYTCRFLTRPGLFSADSLDDGTAALLEHAAADDGDRVLDCCCGYGAVGAFVGARTDCSLWATDDDAVATAYARRNFERNGVEPEAVYACDCIDAVLDRTFDTVISNPPTHAGKGVTRKLFSSVGDVLAEDGTFWLVANRIMDYDDYLVEEFDFETTVVASVDNFDVIRARHSGSA